VPIKRPVALPADFPLAEKRAPIGLAVLTVLLVIGAGYRRVALPAASAVDRRGKSSAGSGPPPFVASGDRRAADRSDVACGDDSSRRSRIVANSRSA